jgi:hypothetical protein
LPEAFASCFDLVSSHFLPLPPFPCSCVGMTPGREASISWKWGSVETLGVLFGCFSGLAYPRTHLLCISSRSHFDIW